jgi:hypothetical protein
MMSAVAAIAPAAILAANVFAVVLLGKANGLDLVCVCFD